MDNSRYVQLRTEFRKSPDLRGCLPRFVHDSRDLGAFWSFIRDEAGTYEERRKLIRLGLKPLFDYLEETEVEPGDTVVRSALTTLGVEQVDRAWSMALRRRTDDPEGALTSARTLLETVIKHILDELSVEYNDKSDLPKLYGQAAEALNIAPSQHSESVFKTILGSAFNLVNGLGTLRNKLSDSHGRGRGLPVRPAPRHASLAVNVAGAVAAFLVETHIDRKPAVAKRDPS